MERFGFYKEIYPQSVIWFHAVSVGEAEALFPLLKLILQHHSDAQLLITTTTPTGSARVKAVMGNTVSHVYLPYDMPDSIARFMAKFKPKMAVIMETELWPNLFIACGQNTIPLYVINARLSDKSARGYKKIPTLVNQALAQVKTIATQTQDDADRFVSIGAHFDGVVDLGNMKFDVDVPSTVISAGADLKNTLFAQRFVWIIASTHTEEEASSSVWVLAIIHTKRWANKVFFKSAPAEITVLGTSTSNFIFPKSTTPSKCAPILTNRSASSCVWVAMVFTCANA